MSEPTTIITLRGETEYNPNYPPRDPKKGYIAKITGRQSGPAKYDREFMGKTAEFFAGDEGLYERQVGKKKGGCVRWYYVILSHPEHGLIISRDCEDELPKIAKLLDDGVAIEDAVEIHDLSPSEEGAGRMTFTAVARTAAQAKAARKSATIESAVADCWTILSLLPEREQKKVVKAIREKMAPPKPLPATSDAPEDVAQAPDLDTL